MQIEWYTPDTGPSRVTIASYGISFNKEASEILGNTPYVKFGFIKDSGKIVIKPCFNNEDNALNLVENIDTGERQ